VKVTVPSLDDPSMLPWIAQHLKTSACAATSSRSKCPRARSHQPQARARVHEGLGPAALPLRRAAVRLGPELFQLLKHVDAKYLKIDRTFMADFAKNKENQAKVKEICDQAHAHGKLTIAEFVEDAASMSILFTLGVNFVAGQLLQEPEK
jgi:hypothetical protein